MLGEVAAHAVEVRLPDGHQDVDRALADLERRQVRKEVVPDEEDEKDPVVHRALEVERERVHRGRELDGEVLAQDSDVEEDERLERGRLLDRVRLAGHLLGLALALRRVVPHLPARVAPAPLLVLREDVLAQDAEVRLVRREREHDQVRVEAVDDVLRVRVVRRVAALAADEVHDLVLALARDGRVRDDDLHLCGMAGSASVQVSYGKGTADARRPIQGPR